MRSVNPARSKARTARPRNAAATRAALVAAAAKAFNGPGYFSTDSNAIAAAAGYAPGSFYKHFRDKADILLAVYDDYGLREWEGLHRALGGAGGRRARLRRALAFIVEFHAAWGTFRAGIRAVARMEPLVAEALGRSRARQLGLLSEATGLSPVRHRASLLLTLSIVERLSETIAEAPAERDAVLAAAVRAISALLAVR